MEANRDIIVGIKIMATGGALAGEGMKPLARARRLGDQLNLPLLVHIGESWNKDTEPVHVGEVLEYLRAGDIVTHMFTAHPGGLLDPNGRLWPQVRDAKASGVLMDVGHGLHNLNFDVARKVVDQGLEPDGVSTDGHRGNRAGPVYDLPTTMAKLMALGFSLEQVVAMATTNAAKLLGRSEDLDAFTWAHPRSFPFSDSKSASGRRWTRRKERSALLRRWFRFTPFAAYGCMNPYLWSGRERREFFPAEFILYRAERR